MIAAQARFNVALTLVLLPSWSNARTEVVQAVAKIALTGTCCEPETWRR